MKCPSCGASLPEDSLTCEYCGSRTTPPSQQHDQDIFRRVKQSPLYADRLSAQRIEKLPKPGIFPLIFIGVFFTLFCGGALFMSIMVIGVGGMFSLSEQSFPFALFPFCMGLVPLGMCAFGVFMAVTMFKRFKSMSSGKVEAVPAIIVGKRTQVSGGSGDSSASTAYFATVEFEDGERKEFMIYDGSLYGRISEDDAGILFSREQFAVDFDRVRI
ncbi:hypothetical protein Pan97_05420 [Bremerella volcania]|uniref:Zinc-ribbon domain-containing protein n=1 Tax=Bremerella volcania TaxID=2527984 RepID=A0A518C2V1_9BACT|nr:DUF2500 family protein [Bremerella volcania]QDU73566.1 hypothetical protein Pan97_05420 [Bremerella volcania]